MPVPVLTATLTVKAHLTQALDRSALRACASASSTFIQNKVEMYTAWKQNQPVWIGYAPHCHQRISTANRA